MFFVTCALAVSWACNPGPAPPPAVANTAQTPISRPQQPSGATRTEHDLLGDKQIPADAYYGVQTARALENFQISGIPINHYPGFIEAWAIVKLAAARANTDVGAMKKETLDAIEKGRRRACVEASTTISSRWTGTRAAPAPPRT
jgi:hypothetical protein